MILVRRPCTVFDVDVVGAVVLLIAGVVAWFGVAAPIRAHQERLRALAAASSASESAMQRALEQVRRVEADNRKLNDALGRRTHEAPTSAALPTLLNQLSGIADDVGLQITQLVPLPTRKLDGRVVSDVQVTARGDALALAHFLERLRRENPCHALTDYAIVRNKDGGDDRCLLTWTLRMNLLGDDAGAAVVRREP